MYDFRLDKAAISIWRDQVVFSTLSFYSSVSTILGSLSGAGVSDEGLMRVASLSVALCYVAWTNPESDGMDGF